MIPAKSQLHPGPEVEFAIGTQFMTVRFTDLEQMEGMNSSWIRDLEVGTPIWGPSYFSAVRTAGDNEWLLDSGPGSWQPIIEDRPIFRCSNSSREMAWMRVPRWYWDLIENRPISPLGKKIREKIGFWTRDLYIYIWDLVDDRPICSLLQQLERMNGLDFPGKRPQKKKKRFNK